MGPPFEVVQYGQHPRTGVTNKGDPATLEDQGPSGQGHRDTLVAPVTVGHHEDTPALAEDPATDKQHREIAFPSDPGAAGEPTRARRLQGRPGRPQQGAPESRVAAQPHQPVAAETQQNVSGGRPHVKSQQYGAVRGGGQMLLALDNDAIPQIVGLPDTEEALACAPATSERAHRQGQTPRLAGTIGGSPRHGATPSAGSRHSRDHGDTSHDVLAPWPWQEVEGAHERPDGRGGGPGSVAPTATEMPATAEIGA